MSPPAIVALVAGILIVLPAFWCAVVLLLSYLSGWQALAASYEAKEPPRGTLFSGQSGSVGIVSYRNSLTVHAAPDGFFLTVPAIFRIGHKPLFIPWSAVRNRKPVKILWYEAVSFEVGSPRVAELRLPPRIFEARSDGVLAR